MTSILSKITPARWALIIIGFFFVIRFFGITNPPTDEHSWRQCVTNMLTRNLIEVDYNPMHPRIDMAGDKTGITGTELPVYNMLTTIISLIFGYQHWHGRVINLIVTSLGALAFFYTIKNLLNTRIAMYAMVILTVSIWFNFGRKCMPDTFSMSFMLIGIYSLQQYFENKNWKWAAGFILAGVVAGLSKMPSIYLMPVVALFTLLEWNKGNKKEAIVAVAGMGIVTLITALWFFVWVPFLVETYQFQHYFPVSIMQGIKDAYDYRAGVFQRYSFDSLHSYIGFIMFIIGLILMIDKGNKLALGTFAISTAVFVVYTLKTGAVFPIHNYYIIPFVPVMALVAAYGLSRLQNKYLAIILLLGITVEAIGNSWLDFISRKDHQYKVELEGMIKGKIPQDALIIINGTQDPNMIYFVHRKGWTVNSSDLENAGYFQYMKDKGAKYVIVDKHYGDPNFGLSPFFENDILKLYKL